MATPLNDLRSLGQLTADLQAPFATVRRAAEEAGAVPLLALNGTDYYSARDVELITMQLADIRGRQMTEQRGDRVTMTKQRKGETF